MTQARFVILPGKTVVNQGRNTVIQLHCRKNSKGFTLLEVLVAMVLLAIGLLGVARLQMFGLQNTGNAYFRTQASGLLTEMVERVRANPQGAVDNHYSVAMPSCNVAVSKSCVSDSCSQSELALFDMYTVNCGLNGANDESGVDELLPNGVLALACSDTDSTPAAAPCVQYRASVSWSETNDEDADGVGDTNTISLGFTP
jgi:type IV pilus assembly protein PilV